MIVATGTAPKEIEQHQKAFYHVDDIPPPSDNKKITVIGGGDTAFDSAVSLHEKGYDPTIITRSEVCCLPLLKDEAESRGIKVIKSEDELSDDDCLVLIAVGREPAMIKMPEEGKGLFLVGDVKNGSHRHVHVAAGDGLKAALEVEEIAKSL